jgi:dimethylglycine catabolism B
MTGGLPLVGDVGPDAEHCSYCPKMCRYTCPVAEATGLESVTPWGIDRVIAAMARGDELTAGEMLPVWACTGCRQCGGACVPGLDLPAHVRAGRRHAVAAGAVPEGIDAEAGRDRPLSTALQAGATPGAPTVVFPGCRSADDDALAAVLGAAGIAYATVTGCCGARDADVGLAEAAQQRADMLTGQLADARTIVVADPHCARWLRIDRGDDRVVTLPTFLTRIVARLPLQPAGQPVAWHDPCWLGRGMTEYDDARTVVTAAAGHVPAEPEHTRDRSWCTGGGMGYPVTDPDGAAEILRRRAAELRATGAGVTVTACPTAAARLRDAGLEAFDLAAYVADRLEGPLA